MTKIGVRRRQIRLEVQRIFEIRSRSVKPGRGGSVRARLRQAVARFLRDEEGLRGDRAADRAPRAAPPPPPLFLMLLLGLIFFMYLMSLICHLYQLEVFVSLV